MSKVFVFVLFVAGTALVLYVVYRLLALTGIFKTKPKPVECEMTTQIEKLANKYHKQIRINRISADKLRTDAAALKEEAVKLERAADKLDEAGSETPA